MAEESSGTTSMDVPVNEQTGTGSREGAQDGTAGVRTGTADHEAVGNGWVALPGADRDDAVFMISGSRLGIGPAGDDSVPVWFDLANIKNLDAIGDPVDGVIEVEIRSLDGSSINAGWPQDFCDVVVRALRATMEAPAVSRTLLELEDVTYLGGFPGHTKKRKRCTAALSTEGIEISGHPNLSLGLTWDQVVSLEAQNSDEARFRTNTKIHRDASAIVIEVRDGDPVVLEARDCPTVALRQAIITLLKGVDVTVR